MATKVVSIRIKPQTLADIYNFLNTACEFNVSNLPVSKAVQMSLENMMRWVRQSVDLPDYATDEEALSAVRSYINKVPAAYMEKTTRPALLHTRPPIKEESLDIAHNIPDNSDEVQIGAPTDAMKEQVDRITDNAKIEDKKSSLINLIDQFRDKQDEEDRNNLLDAVKSTDIYKVD